MTTDADLEELRSAYEQLRAENARLREVTHDLSGALEVLSDAEINNDELRATIGRVEMLRARWLAKQFVNLVDQYATHECAQELEAALRGKGS